MSRWSIWAAALASALWGCKPGGRSAGVTDAGAAMASDAYVSASVAPPASDAAPPPDDTMMPERSDEIVTRAGHLLEAIAGDDPALAADIVFPRDGWLAMRDAGEAGKEWERQVAAPFRKSVHALGRRHEAVGRAQSVSFELGHVLVQTTPHKHGWKKPLWTAKASRLTFVVDGHVRTLTIREMTAWRGAWYVTHLR